MSEHLISRRTLGQAIFATSLLGVMGAAAGCTGQGKASTPAGGATAGGAIARALTIGGDVDVQPMNPTKMTSAGAQQMFTPAVYDTLLRFNADGKIVPNIAVKWEANADNTLYTLTLRDGVKFTDGSAYDAAAVKTHIDTMRTSGGTDASRVADLEVTVKDAKTVEIACTKGPNGLVPMFLCLSVGSVAAPAQYASPNADSEPIGAGPYKFDKAKSTTGSSYTLVRNPDYWNKTAFPYDSVVIKVMTDPTARLNALQTGQINAAPLTSQMGKAAESAGLTVLRHQVNWNGLIIFDRLGKKMPALGNLKVRQAINMAFDRQAALQALALGEGEVTNQIFPKTSMAYRDDLKDVYPYDMAKAKALMAEAGFASGFEVTIPYMEGFSSANPMVISQLKQLNITVKEEKLAGMQGFMKILGGEFAMMPFALEARDALWDVVQSVTPSAIWNTLHQEVPELTALTVEAQKAKLGEGKDTFQAIGKYLLDNAWFAPWFQQNAVFGIDKKTTAKTTMGSGYPYLHTYGGQ